MPVTLASILFRLHSEFFPISYVSYGNYGLYTYTAGGHWLVGCPIVICGQKVMAVTSNALKVTCL